ncbi:hypothetical protein ACMHYO_11500 [Allopusillimonas ginsengisoli]|uniref:hypothetical protein n=1 Tax=Allopusillimonas ginsengisoli TaxID=453575 RepID=UPI0039C32B6B
MHKFNVSINGQYVGTVAGMDEQAAAVNARIEFHAADNDRIVVTRVELGRKHHSEAA